jgi:hypothetical protein
MNYRCSQMVRSKPLPHERPKKQRLPALPGKADAASVLVLVLVPALDRAAS